MPSAKPLENSENIVDYGLIKMPLHVVYFGRGGLLLPIPLISLLISFASPMGLPLCPSWKADIADLYVPIVLYLSPLS